MTRLPIAALIAVAVTAHAGDVMLAASPRSCESLRSLELTAGAVTLAETVGAGEFRGAGPGATPGAAFEKLRSFCRVAATLRPSPDSDIKIEVWLPAADWNGKFIAVGNGGWAGTISYAAMADALGRGYATASTDTGHVGGSGAFVLGHPEKLIDFGYRAVREMTVAAKRIVESRYGTSPRRSYWNGCSTGGRQGLTEARRFPEDYDGMIVGAPATPRPLLNGWHLSLVNAALKDPAGFIPVEKHAVVHRAVLEACDALDGLKDGLIADPRKCRFDPSVLTCRGEEGPGCLTARQIATVRTLMSPLRDKAGVAIFPGWEPGSELGWRGVIAGPEPTSLTLDNYKYVVFKNPAWDWRTFDAERDIAAAWKADDDGIVDVREPEVARFVGRGGKMLMYHGWSDPLVPPAASIDKFVHIQQALGGAAKAGQSVRLFMAPGMGHCAGGEGPNTFDAIGALEAWVERGTPPSRIVASHLANGRVDRTRPLCPYPQVATYSGAGNPDTDASFTCREP